MCGIVIHYEEKGEVRSHILDVFEAREVQLPSHTYAFADSTSVAYRSVHGEDLEGRAHGARNRGKGQ